MTSPRWIGLPAALLVAGLTAVPATSSSAQTTLDPAVTLVTDRITIQANRDIKQASDFTSFSDSVSGDGEGGLGHADVTAAATLDVGPDGGLEQIHVVGDLDSFGEGGAPTGRLEMDATIQVNSAVPFTWLFSATTSGGTSFSCNSAAIITGPGADQLQVWGPHPSGTCNGLPTQLTTSVSGVLEPGQHPLAWDGIAFGPFGDAHVQFDATLILGEGTFFDWTMPDRFGADSDGDGLTDYYPPDGNLQIDPGSWQVDFSATDPNHCGPTFTHTWFIDSVQVDPSDPNVIAYDPATCDLSYAFPEEAVYDVGFQITDAQGAVVGTANHAVTVQDFLIVSIGDSVGSGEGNPDIPRPSLRWENQQCHRSAAAGSAQAAKLLEQADPRTSVTFVHLACSGATILRGLLGSYEGIEPGPPLDPQVQQATDLAGGREIDAVMVSIGANDVKFSEAVQSCFLKTDCDDANDPSSAASKFNRRVAFLPLGYTRLSNALNNDVAADRVYITEYFDPTRDDQAQVCDGTILEDAPFAPLGEITAQEATWASLDMLGGLNSEVNSAAAAHGWRYVGGMYADFAAHGYCALDPWVDTYTESQSLQGDRFGSLHPNGTGHADYAGHLQASLQLDLWVGGNLSQPRAPAP